MAAVAIGLFAVSVNVACARAERRTRPVTYVAIGASDTVGEGAADPEKDSWVSIVHRRLPAGSDLVRLGISGSTAAEALVEQVPKAEKVDADIVTIWLAVNDLNATVPASEYEKQLDEIVKRVARPGVRVFVGNVPDLTKIPKYKVIPPVVLRGGIRAYNDAIERVVDKHDAVLVDLFDSSKDAPPGENVVSSDGFHPSAAGYRRIAEVFWKVIEDDPKIGPVVRSLAY